MATTDKPAVYRKKKSEDPLVLDITRPTPVTDDRYTAMLSGRPEIGSFLWSLERFAGDRQVDCRFRIPQLGEDIVVPGLNAAAFAARTTKAYTARYEDTDIELVRLPRVYEILNEAMTASAAEAGAKWEFLGTGAGQVYDWELEKSRVKTALADLGTRIIEKTALRTHKGCGFRGLAQANPNLSRYQVGVGLDLAHELLRDVRRAEARRYGKPTGRFESITDLAGLKLNVLVRFPATTSFSVRLDMYVVLCGRGRCVYVNPRVLKSEMEGDVDGDQLFGEIDPRLVKRQVEDTILSVPLQVTPVNFAGDYSLRDVKALPPADDLASFLGMAGKEGIGEVTNLFYRGMLVIHVVFQYEAEMRSYFWDCVDRPDLRALSLEGPDEEANRKRFRHLSSRVLMDSFTAFYEGTFDLRKDDTIREYLESLLAAIRGQRPMDFDFLSRMMWKGKPVDVVPMALLWDAARVKDQVGRVTQFISQYPILDLFFKGRGVTWAKRELFERIMDETDVPDLAQFIVDELQGVHHTLMLPGEAGKGQEEFYN